LPTPLSARINTIKVSVSDILDELADSAHLKASAEERPVALAVGLVHNAHELVHTI